MVTDFPRILTLLRKEKGVSQKSAAADLEISQALLSHYEKGIRECGLSFLVRCADYYGVSCDYLLGRSPERQGATLLVEDIPETDFPGRDENRGSVLPVLSRKLLANSQNLLFDLLAKTGSKSLISEVSAYLMLSVYKMFRLVYSTNPKNQDAMFSLPFYAAMDFTDAAMNIAEAGATSVARGSPLPGFELPKEAEELVITTESLTQSYPMWASSLFNLIQSCERRIDFRHKMRP